MLHIIALAQYAITHSRSWAADSFNTRARQAVPIDNLVLVGRQGFVTFAVLRLWLWNRRTSTASRECITGIVKTIYLVIRVVADVYGPVGLVYAGRAFHPLRL